MWTKRIIKLSVLFLVGLFLCVIPVDSYYKPEEQPITFGEGEGDFILSESGNKWYGPHGTFLSKEQAKEEWLKNRAEYEKHFVPEQEWITADSIELYTGDITITDRIWRVANLIEFYDYNFLDAITMRYYFGDREPIAIINNSSGDTVEMSKAEFQDAIYAFFKEYALIPWEEYQGKGTWHFPSAEWILSGIACLLCGKELEKYIPDSALLIIHYRDDFRCPNCGWKGIK